MLTTFFNALRTAKVPVTLKEYLTLMEALAADQAAREVESFYYLSRASLVKDERHYDRFDRVFAHVFRGLDAVSGGGEGEEQVVEIPAEWLKAMTELYLSEDERKRIEALGDWDKIMDELRKRLAEQHGRHQGGNKWIGTGGTSPYGAYGYNPAGIRIGQHESRHRRAIKVWDKREFRDLDDGVELGTRNMKVALRRLRKFARSGAAEELDLDGTIKGSAQKGYIDIALRPERRNMVKVLMFFDIGGSMDDHVKIAEALFSAARAEFKHLEQYYFHNCLYEFVWKQNVRRWTERIPTRDVLNTYGTDYKVIFVGDATMSPYEITHRGGSVEHMNDEAGAVWLKRVTDRFPHVVWLNPNPEGYWDWTESTRLIRQIIDQRMYPMTLEGLDAATRELMR
jgi:uncharacterized protein with von Willebrand factor type A (vWA) domain